MKKFGKVLLAGAILLGLGTTATHTESAETATAKTKYESPYKFIPGSKYNQNNRFWVYQVTKIKNGEYYGVNDQYQYFPNVYFTKDELKKGQKIKEGDFVVTVFEHDDLVEVIKLPSSKGGK